MRAFLSGRKVCMNSGVSVADSAQLIHQLVGFNHVGKKQTWRKKIDEKVRRMWKLRLKSGYYPRRGCLQ